jgi:trans-2,3-dihydro-3-hydroxyanthranilate isomerase
MVARVSRLVWVDVFAAGPMSGNPLALVLGADAWPSARMQALAAELGLSETAFVLRSTADADHRLRIFTPVRELPLAGHPVVGAAWVMRAAGRLPERGRIETGAGVLPVHVRGDVATIELAPPLPGPLVDADEVARAAGAPAGDGPPAQVWSTGVEQLMLPVSGEEALEDARPDHEALAALGERDGWLGVSLYAVLPRADGERPRARVRHFAPRLGVPEDPVTGSAAGALGACLAAAGLGDGGALELVVSQGARGGRGGEVAVRVAGDDGQPRRVQVGGRVVPLMEGRLIGV